MKERVPASASMRMTARVSDISGMSSSGQMSAAGALKRDLKSSWENVSEKAIRFPAGEISSLKSTQTRH